MVVFILNSNDKMIGFVSYTPYTEENSVEINHLYIIPLMRRKKFGTSLCQAIIKKIKSQNFNKVSTWITEESHQARKFYETIGFCPSSHIRIDKIRKNFTINEIQYDLKL